MANWPVGAIEERDIVYFADGNMWCAVRPEFTDLMESPAGFGETQELARLELKREEQS